MGYLILNNKVKGVKYKITVIVTTNLEIEGVCIMDFRNKVEFCEDKVY